MDFQLYGLLIKAISIFILLAIIGRFVFGIVCLIRLLLKIIKLKQPRIITYQATTQEAAIQDSRTEGRGICLEGRGFIRHVQID